MAQQAGKGALDDMSLFSVVIGTGGMIKHGDQGIGSGGLPTNKEDTRSWRDRSTLSASDAVRRPSRLPYPPDEGAVKPNRNIWEFIAGGGAKVFMNESSWLVSFYAGVSATTAGIPAW